MRAGNAEVEELKYTNQNLTSENENLTSALKSAKAEIERLQKQLKEGFDLSDGAFEIVKAEAIKEFAERLKAKGTSPELDEGKYYSDYDIERTLEEMEERE